MPQTLPMSTLVQAQSTSGRIRLLVVEANARLLRALLDFLATETAIEVVGSARSADEAAIEAGKVQPEIVLMDWSLPASTLERACWLIRLRLAPPRIVALLDDDDESYRDSAARAGADAAVGKTRLNESLLPTLRRLFPARLPGK